MTQKTAVFLASLGTLAGATPALAHPGHHEQMSLAELGHHLVSSPYHMGLIAVGVLVLAGILWRAARKN